MDLGELLEAIRALVAEPQRETVERPYAYSTPELITQIRSALRMLRALGLPLEVTLSLEGELSPERMEEREGTLVALHVARDLLAGDLVARLRSGELGLYFRAGPDIMDTRASAGAFLQAAARAEARLQTLLSIAITEGTAGSAYFGEPGF